MVQEDMTFEKGILKLRKSPFQVGKKYRDAIGRRWKILHSYWLPKGDQADEYYIVRNWRKGLALAVRDTETTASVLFDDGFTTIYAEEEE